MNKNFGVLLLLLAFIFSGVAGAATIENFKARTTQDIVDLCSTPVDDPTYTAAIHFCHGYLIGAFHYYLAESSGPEGKRLVCLPNPPPSRNEAIKMYIEWAKAHPEYMGEAAVDTEFRFLIETWPCEEQSGQSKGGKP